MLLKINGVDGLDGEYPVDLVRFKNKDHRTITEVSGLRVLEYQEAIEKGDIRFIVAVAFIVLNRSGKVFDVEQLWDADDDALAWEFEVGEVDASPPVVESSPELVSEKNSSGEASNGSMEPSPVTLTLTDSGSPPSDTGSDSGRETFFSLLQAS